MFYKKHIMSHSMNHCARRYVAVIIHVKTMASPMFAIYDKWVSVHGAMQDMMVYGEIGIEGWQADKYFENHTFKLILRAPG